MPAYIEVAVIGGRHGYIEAGSIMGLITSPNMGMFDIPSKTAPLTLILRGGESFEVIGESAGKILARALQVRERLRKEGLDILVDYLEPLGHDEEAPPKE